MVKISVWQILRFPLIFSTLTISFQFVFSSGCTPSGQSNMYRCANMYHFFSEQHKNSALNFKQCSFSLWTKCEAAIKQKASSWEVNGTRMEKETFLALGLSFVYLNLRTSFPSNWGKRSLTCFPKRMTYTRSL